MPRSAQALFPFARPVLMTGAGAACALGSDLDSCLVGLRSGQPALRPLAELGDEFAGFGNARAGCIADRSYLRGRRHGAATNAAVRVAREAMAAAGWRPDECARAWLWVGTSRGNAGEMLGTWPQRRPHRKFAASNSMHSELAAAVSLDLAVGGPWQVISNGCASGLDALGWASLSIASGWTDRALAVSVDLPLVPRLLHDFASTGILSPGGRNDPYHPATDGFSPAEGAAAVTLETATDARPAWCVVEGYAAGSDGHNTLGLPTDGLPLAELIGGLTVPLGGVERIRAVCPHATGTSAHRISESEALARAFGTHRPSLHLLKPFTGHALGASGLLDTALLAASMRDGALPPNVRGLSPPADGWRMPDPESPPVSPGPVLKISAGMGGHNALVVLRPAQETAGS